VVERFALGLQKSARKPRSKLALLLSSATALSAALYGTEHFMLDDIDD
jgi:hypothetical protein